MTMQQELGGILGRRVDLIEEAALETPTGARPFSAQAGGGGLRTAMRDTCGTCDAAATVGTSCQDLAADYLRDRKLRQERIWLVATTHIPNSCAC